MACEAPAAVVEIELFRSANLLVRVVGCGRADACVITFACLLDVPGLAVPGFGEGFLRDRGIDAVHVTCAGNDWYQYPELFAALDAIHAAVRPYRRVLAYGSSMGAYAAVRYGGRAGAQEALAISPQFSIDPRHVPFETRWRKPASAIRFRHEDEAFAIGRVTAVYDPSSLDAHHVALIAAVVPVRHVRLMHAGHPAGAYLAEVDLLSELVLALSAGEALPDIERRARAARHWSGQYLFSLARRLPQRRVATKLALARRAVKAVPSEPMYLSYQGLLLDRIGDADGAAAAHHAAAALAPDSPLVLARFARFLLRRGCAREGREVAQAVYRLAAEAPRNQHLLYAALLVEGRVSQALRVMHAAADRHGLRPGLLLDGTRAIIWRPANPGWRLRLSRLHVDRLPLHLGTPDELRTADVSTRRPARRAEPRSV